MGIFFPDTTLHRYGIVESQSGVYGETIQEYSYIDDIICDFQNETSNEIAHSYGIELGDLYRIYTDISTSLDSSDILRDEDDVEYEIIGGIKQYKKFHKYKTAHLKRRRT